MRLFKVLVCVQISKSKAVVDVQYKKHCKRGLSRIAERLMTI